MNAREARAVIIRAWEALGLPQATEGGLESVQSHFAKESGYGEGWKAGCEGSNNWGAVQAGKPPCGENACEYTDTHPNPDGTSSPYSACFRTYASPLEGAMHALEIMFGRNANKPAFRSAQSGDLLAFSRDLYNQHYFEGHGKTVGERILNNAKAMNWNAERIAKSLEQERATWLHESAGADHGPSDYGVVIGFALFGGLLLAKRTGVI